MDHRIGCATVTMDLGLLEALKLTEGYKTDAELAAGLRVSRETLRRVRLGQAPSGVLIASVALKLGRPVADIVVLGPIKSNRRGRQRPEA
ncbi:hypothetical protein [Nocardia colli]|uniref:hypothetical protein n=1 Tax=Nocardia colli TaxID=2545717 RepID=UPI0035D8CACA